MHELWCVTGNVMTNITPLVGSISRRSNINELGEQLDFDIGFNDNRFFPKNPVDVGSLLILRGSSGAKEVMRAIAIKENTSSGAIKYNCFDYAFYLNKSKAVYQFKKMMADQAIKKILSDFKIPIGSLCSISYPITKIYSDKVVSEIIKDILTEAENALGIRYRMEMRTGKLYIEKQSALLIAPTFKLAYNIAPTELTNTISNPNRTRSIENMRNSIKIVTGDENHVRIVTETKNESLIKQYGILQEVKQIDQKDLSQARMIAKNILNELGKVFEENSIEMLGHDDVRAGRMVEIKEPITGMKGKYIITDATHSIKSGNHTVKVGLEVV